MTYGPVVIVNSPGTYTSKSSIPNVSGSFGAPVRQTSDVAALIIHDELSTVYYLAWKFGNSYVYGDWDKLSTIEESRKQFNILCHLTSIMGEIAFHYVNLDLGTPVDEYTYRFVETSERFRWPPFADEIPVPSYPPEGQLLQDVETYEDQLPIWLNKLDAYEIPLGKPTRGIRDYFISLCLASTGVDLTGVF